MRPPSAPRSYIPPLKAKMKVLSLMVAVLVLLPCASGNSNGAPVGACATLSPSPAMHSAGPQNGASPFNLTINSTVPNEYVPGEVYEVTMSSSRVFLGFLLLGQDTGNNSVGSFIVGDRTGQQQQCGVNGITHTVRLNANSVTFTWMAPPIGTGTVTIRYAGVETRMVYWANQVGLVLSEEAIINQLTSTSTSTSPEPSTSISPEPSTSTSPESSTSTSPESSTSISPETSTSTSPEPSTSTSPESSTSTSPESSTSTSPESSTVSTSPETSTSTSPESSASTSPESSTSTSPESSTVSTSPERSTVSTSPETSTSTSPESSTSTSSLPPVQTPTPTPGPLTCPRDELVLSDGVLVWPSTEPGKNVMVPCPGNMIIMTSASRNCSINGTWEPGFACPCLASMSSQQLCSSADAAANITAGLTNLNASSNDTLTADELLNIINLVEVTNSNPMLLADDMVRQSVANALDRVLSTPRNVISSRNSQSSIESIITGSIATLAQNTPVPVGGSTNITSAQGNLVITITRQPEAAVRMNGVQASSGQTPVNLPAGLFSDILGGGSFGDVTLVVSTFPQQEGTFQTTDNTFLLNSNISDISLFGRNGRITVENLNPVNRVTFNVTKNGFQPGRSPLCCFYNENLRQWTSDGCEIIPVSDTICTCACTHLTAFAVLSGSVEAPQPFSPLVGLLVGFALAVSLIVLITGAVMLGIVCYRKYGRSKNVLLRKL